MLTRCPPGLAMCANLTAIIAVPISRGMASLKEMNADYGLEEACDMMEIVAVDNHNARVWAEWSKHERR